MFAAVNKRHLFLLKTLPSLSLPTPPRPLHPPHPTPEQRRLNREKLRFLLKYKHARKLFEKYVFDVAAADGPASPELRNLATALLTMDEELIVAAVRALEFASERLFAMDPATSTARAILEELARTFPDAIREAETMQQRLSVAHSAKGGGASE